jgi:L-alanine-DL-glutamate epimerase-like enolase superfamily enzyme
MKIKDIRTETVSIPLKTPFKTALRTVSSVNDIIVKIIADTGHVGYGEAAPAGVITGDTTGAIEDHIRPAIIGHDIEGVV